MSHAREQRSERPLRQVVWFAGLTFLWAWAVWGIAILTEIVWPEPASVFLFALGGVILALTGAASLTAALLGLSLAVLVTHPWGTETLARPPRWLRPRSLATSAPSSSRPGVRL